MSHEALAGFGDPVVILIAQGLTLASVPVGDNGYKLQRAGAAAMGKANGVYHYALQNAF